MRYFLIALGFLTVLPVRIKKIRDYEFGRSLRFFPLVGIIIGAILALSLHIFSSVFPHIATSALILIVLIIITGGIHLDGFADTCDGLYGNQTKEKILEIMHDSRIGVMGVLGVTSILLLKFAIFYSIPLNLLWKILIIMATLSRYAQVLACYSSDYVREEGKGKYFVEYARRKELIVSGIFSLVLVISLMGLKGFILLLLLTLIVLLLIGYIKKRIGGMNGDTIGAVSEISGIIVLFSSLILEKINLC